jgi:hypothetical protein
MDAAQRVTAFVKQVSRDQADWNGLDIEDFKTGAVIAALEAEQQVEIVLEAVTQQVAAVKANQVETRFYLDALIGTLLKRKLPFEEQHLQQLLSTLATSDCALSRTLGNVLGAVKVFLYEQEMPEGIRAELVKLVEATKKWPEDAGTRKIRQTLDVLLDDTLKLQPPGLRFTTGEPWTDTLHEALNRLSSTERSHGEALVLHCNAAKGSKPAQKWLREAGKLIVALGPDQFASVLVAVLAEIGKPGPPPTRNFAGHVFELDPTMIHDDHSDLLRGLIWCTSLVPRDSLLAAVGDAAEICFKKIPGFGPRAPKIGNACLAALANLSTPAAVAQLSRLKTQAKHRSTRKQLGKALESAATKAGVTPEDLEETAVPTGGFTEVGSARQQLGDFTAQVQVDDRGRVGLSWLRSGKTQRTTPAAVKLTHGDELRSLQRMVKEANKLLNAQRHRLEGLLRGERSWSWADFRTHYLDHPLVGTLARRLIWSLGDGPAPASAIWHDGRLVDEHGKAIKEPTAATRVSLWHPLRSSVAQVEAWRIWLEEHGVRQPFKQAHREIYVFTAAEQQTETYSNRFAGHILRQHQFVALCQERGWNYQLQGSWDSANAPTLELPGWDLRCEFWVEGVGESGYTGFAHVATDQVRFYRTGEREPLALAEVPPLVFSEVLRDVDLFVGVASVGNDPNWSDGGPDGRYRDYWERYSFGELSATAETRRALLERLIPRLKIADRCTLADRFLIVRGSLRAYKIHLGSGNILMSPNDQYLCIVPNRGAEERIHLPFDGDGTLSVILSKAFLLAEDAKITDPTITSQLRRGN